MVVPPTIADTVIEIDLSHNSIGVLDTDSFENCSYLQKIDLSHNIINVLPKKIFDQTLMLQKLGLEYNRLEYDGKSFPDGIFRKQLALKSVSLQSDKVSSISNNNFVITIWKLPLTLEELKINIPNADGYTTNLVNFTILKKLGLFDYHISTTPINLTNSTFKPLENLPIEELEIKTDRIHVIEPLAFYHFPKLITLNMSFMTGMSISDFYPAWIGLQHTQHWKD